MMSKNIKLTDIQKKIYKEINVQDLILIIERTPIIWDTRDDSYKNFAWKDRHIWPRIANQLGLFACPDVVAALKVHWRNIKTQYGQQLSKMKKSESAGEDYKITWRYFNTLSFLSKIMVRNPNTSSNLGSVVTNSKPTVGSNDGTDDIKPQEMCNKRNELPVKPTSVTSVPILIPLTISKANFMLQKENTEKLKKVAETDRLKIEMRKDEYQKEEPDEDRNTFINMVNVLLPMVKKLDTHSKEDYFEELYDFTKKFYRQRCPNK